MQRHLQLTLVGLAVFAVFAGCKRSPPAVMFTLVEASGWSQLELAGCPPVRVTVEKVEGAARYSAADGLQVLSGPVKLERLDPPLPPNAPAGAAFVPVLVRAALPDCHDLTYRVPPGFFRAAPVSVAQLEAGWFELAGSGSETVVTYDPRANERAEGTLSWKFRYVFASASARVVAAPSLQVWDRCLHLVDPPIGEEETAAFSDAGCFVVETDGGSQTTRRVFGTLFERDPKTGATTTALDVRVIGFSGPIAGGLREWQDPDGDGRVNTEKQTMFFGDGGWAGSEQTEWSAAGVRSKRYRKSLAPDQMILTVEEDWVDGGWLLVDEKLSSARHPPRP